MGAVFRARDTKLDRDVAIKLLPTAFAQDVDRVARFTREAKVLASLNHPNIAGIYGLEESGGLTALVMELVAGEDLSQVIARGQRHAEAASVSERLRHSASAAPRRAGATEKSRPSADGASRGQAEAERGSASAEGHGSRHARGGGAPRNSSLDGTAPSSPRRDARPGIPLADALAIARQIADALEAAHEQGIVHRDLKPANIKLKGVWGPTPTRLPDGRLAPTHSASDVAGCTVKVLDFGLAKALGEETQTSNGSGWTAPGKTSPMRRARREALTGRSRRAGGDGHGRIGATSGSMTWAVARRPALRSSRPTTVSSRGPRTTSGSRMPRATAVRTIVSCD